MKFSGIKVVRDQTAFLLFLIKSKDIAKNNAKVSVLSQLLKRNLPGKIVGNKQSVLTQAISIYIKR